MRHRLRTSTVTADYGDHVGGDEFAAKDLFGAPSASPAQQRLNETAEPLERFAEAVDAVKTPP